MPRCSLGDVSLKRLERFLPGNSVYAQAQYRDAIHSDQFTTCRPPLSSQLTQKLCYNIAMMRRKTLHAAALSLFVLLTVPGFALLCRGHSPSRFSAANLPFWERSLPHQAAPLADAADMPIAPSAVQFSGGMFDHNLAAVNFNALFYSLDHPSHSGDSPKAGQPGVWLQSACALGRHDRHLAQLQDYAATRLMSTQDNDGYLAAGLGRGRWSSAEIKATAENIRGLLAYYAISHNPAAVYAAMQAGDLLAAHFSPTGVKSPGTAALTLPMVLLYRATSEPRYLRWAEKRANLGGSDGAGLCALYLATGNKHYLVAARGLWEDECAAKRPDPGLAASLWTLTDSPGYLHALRKSPQPWLCPIAPGSLAYARVRDGIAVNAYTSSQVRIGTVRLTQRLVNGPRRSPGKAIVISLQMPEPTAFALRLNTDSIPAGTVPLKDITINGDTASALVHSANEITIVRRWKAGDTVRLNIGSSQ